MENHAHSAGIIKRVYKSFTPDMGMMHQKRAFMFFSS